MKIWVKGLFKKFKFNQPTYRTPLVSDAGFSNPSVVYNTQCSLHHVPSLMPITQLPHPSTLPPPATLSLFPRVKRYFLVGKPTIFYSQLSISYLKILLRFNLPNIKNGFQQISVLTRCIKIGVKCIFKHSLAPHLNHSQ